MQSTGFESDLFEEDDSSDALSTRATALPTASRTRSARTPSKALRPATSSRRTASKTTASRKTASKRTASRKTARTKTPWPPRATSMRWRRRTPTSGPGRTRATDSKKDSRTASKATPSNRRSPMRPTPRTRTSSSGASGAASAVPRRRCCDGSAAVRCQSVCVCCARAPGALAGSRDRRLEQRSAVASRTSSAGCYAPTPWTPLPTSRLTRRSVKTKWTNSFRCWPAWPGATPSAR